MKSRLFSTIAISTTALFLLTSCAQGGSQTESVLPADVAGTPVGTVTDGLLSDTTMTFVSWGGDFQSGQEASFSEPFAAASGATVMSDGPTDAAKIRAQVESGNVSWDVVNASPTMNAANCGVLFEPLNLDLIDTSAMPENAPAGECFLSSLSYGYGIFYDVDKYGDNPPSSWADFFDTDGFPGTRAVDGRAVPTAGTFEAALLADGVAQEDLYPLDTDRSLDKWSDIEDSLNYWSTGAEQTQMAQSGEADMIFGWSGRIFEANQSGANFAPVWDGAFLASDSFSIVKGGNNIVAAHAYINYALGAEQQTQMAELTSYSPVNVNATPKLSAEALIFDVSQPEVAAVTIPQNAEYWGQNLDELGSAWSGWLN
ncbi:ABC transporter substrate-binding protein [Cryobacterium sp. TMT1-3]|uniref:ABC transporter substrate-binding protein n=1 Tax=Cryobacterium sp. TMT1-3 TaxID=1259237 RepID=UPI00106CE53A|nr:ABC transporter substrate-binding protein [Cryobacterium sp. TMT1-3]TFC28588.1 ABC transporter substrate-binding protein [Cryobacterium sp. TMT1-3]